MIYTSCYKNYRKFPKGITIASIAKYSPSYLDIKEYKLLAPDNVLLRDWKRNKINWGEYKRRFFELLLSRLKNVEELLIKLDKGYYLLLCYEDKDAFCHRHLLQEFCGLYLPELEIIFKEI